MIHIAL